MVGRRNTGRNEPAQEIMKALLTTAKLNKLWPQRQQVPSVASTDWLPGKAHLRHFMTIKFDGGQSQTWERKRSALQGVDVTSSPVKAHQIKD